MGTSIREEKSKILKAGFQFNQKSTKNELKKSPLKVSTANALKKIISYMSD